MLHRCQPCNFHMNIASALPSPLSRRFLCQTAGEICLRVVTRGEGFHRLQPGCGGCLGEIEAFLSAWWVGEAGGGGQDGRERIGERRGKGGGGRFNRQTLNVAPEVSICRQEGRNIHGNTDRCVRTSAHKHHHQVCVKSHTLFFFLFFSSWGMMMTEWADTAADRQPHPRRLCPTGEALYISRSPYLQSHPRRCP